MTPAAKCFNICFAEHLLMFFVNMYYIERLLIADESAKCIQVWIYLKIKTAHLHSHTAESYLVQYTSLSDI